MARGRQSGGLRARKRLRPRARGRYLGSWWYCELLGHGCLLLCLTSCFLLVYTRQMLTCIMPCLCAGGCRCLCPLSSLVWDVLLSVEGGLPHDILLHPIWAVTHAECFCFFKVSNSCHDSCALLQLYVWLNWFKFRERLASGCFELA